MNLILNMDEYLPLRDVVFKTLRQAILKGELAPGERLMEVKLANTLGVSRTPIREAIRMLELEGLVVMVPRRGAEVAKISVKHLKDVLEVRGALEELSAILACQRMDDKEAEDLMQAVEQFKEVVYSEDLMLIAQRDEQIHDVIYHATKNEKLVQMINNLREQMYRFRLEYIKDKKKRSGIVEEHEKILDAILAKDVEKAKAAVRKHIDNQELTVLQNLSQKNEK